MCQISRKTVIRANRMMIEHRSDRVGKSTATNKSGIFISVTLNGRLYSQTISHDKLREAFKQALKESEALHGTKL